MDKTLVIQSYRADNVSGWIKRCLQSVRAWTSLRGWDYQFIGDEIFERVPAWYRMRAKDSLPIITDLGRLLLIREALEAGFTTAYWVDADVIVFDPKNFILEVDADYAFSRELWVQSGAKGFKIYRNVHNAFCMFRQGNPFLEYYIHACLQIMERVDGGIPNQIVGTKLLTAMHNMIGFPLVEQVGMISPLVLHDLSKGKGPALKCLSTASANSLNAVNLCGSLVGQKKDGVSVDDGLMVRAVEFLLKEGAATFRKL